MDILLPSTKKLSGISVFFPCYNDRKSLEDLLTTTYKLVPSLAHNFEVLVINDGSNSLTIRFLQGLQKKFPNVKILHHKKNLGYGAALKTGFTHSKKDWIFYTDGDGQYDVSELALLIQKVGKNIDVVNGYKLGRKDSVVRKMLGNIYNKFLHFLYRIPISDVDCDFRLIKKSLIEKISLTSTSGMICLELIVKLQKTGARFAEVGAHHYPRRYGKSEFFTVKNILLLLRDHILFFLEHQKKR